MERIEPYLMQMKMEGKDPESNGQVNIEEKKELSSLTVNNRPTYPITDNNRFYYGEERDYCLKKIRAEKKELSQNEKEAWNERIKGLSKEELEYIASLIDPEILVSALMAHVRNAKALQKHISETYEIMRDGLIK